MVYPTERHADVEARCSLANRAINWLHPLKKLRNLKTVICSFFTRITWIYDFFEYKFMNEREGECKLETFCVLIEDYDSATNSAAQDVESYVPNRVVTFSDARRYFKHKRDPEIPVAQTTRSSLFLLLTSKTTRFPLRARENENETPFAYGVQPTKKR